MLDKSIPVDTGSVEGGNAVEYEHQGVLLVNEFDCLKCVFKEVIEWLGMSILKIGSFWESSKGVYNLPKWAQFRGSYV